MICTAFALCLAVQLAAPGDATPAAKIGFVDREELYKAPRVEKALQTLRESIQSSESEFEKLMEDYDEERRDFDLKKEFMDEEAIQVREAELEARKQKILGYLREEKESLEGEREEVMRKIIEEIRAVVQKVAQERGYTLVLWKSALAYGAKEHDLTHIVMKRYLDEGGNQ